MTEKDKKQMIDCYMAEIKTNALVGDTNTAKGLLKGYEKAFSLHVVMQQRELLFAFEKMRTSHIIGATDEWRYANVDLFLSK